MAISRFGLGAMLVVAVIVSACGGDQPAAPGAEQPAASEQSSGAAQAAAGIDELLAKADLKRGQTMYFQCRACHSLKEGEPHKVGPNLHGVFGAKAGLAPGFTYSEAMANSEVVWTVAAMDEWLARPSKFMPGNRMVFVGVKDAVDRANLIAYVMQETGAQ